MNEFNPLAGSILQSTQVQQQQSADKTRQVRRQQDLGKNIATATDQYEHTVESTEGVAAIHEDDSKDQPQKRRKKSKHSSANGETPDDGDEKAHIDLTA